MLDFIYIPFSYLMKGCLYIAGNHYLWALLFFTIAMQIVLLPIAIKQQKSQIMMAKVRPKEMAIREKYKGRNDRATQQKMTMEIQEMYQANGYNQLSGCLPLLIQLPIILILFTIVRQPITYVSNLPENFATDNVTAAVEFYNAEKEDLDEALFESKDDYDEAVATIDGYIAGLGTSERLGSYGESELSRLIIDGRDNIESLRPYLKNPDEIVKKYEETGLEAYKDELPNYRVFSLNLLDEPTFDSWLILIPILVFLTSFLGTKVTRHFSGNTQTDANGNPVGGGLFMEVGMPLMSAVFAYGFPASMGIYWIWRTLVNMLQTVILAKAMPIPKVTEEQIAEAKREMKSKQKKKKKVITIEVDEDDNSYDSLVVDKSVELDPSKRTPRKIEMLTLDDDEEISDDNK